MVFIKWLLCGSLRLSIAQSFKEAEWFSSNGFCAGVFLSR